jgi:hypothetical protein
MHQMSKSLQCHLIRIRITQDTVNTTMTITEQTPITHLMYTKILHYINWIFSFTPRILFDQWIMIQWWMMQLFCRRNDLIILHEGNQHIVLLKSTILHHIYYLQYYISLANTIVVCEYVVWFFLNLCGGGLQILITLVVSCVTWSVSCVAWSEKNIDYKVPDFEKS